MARGIGEVGKLTSARMRLRFVASAGLTLVAWAGPAAAETHPAR